MAWAHFLASEQGLDVRGNHPCAVAGAGFPRPGRAVAPCMRQAGCARGPLPAARLCFPGAPGEGSAAPGAPPPALPAGSAGPAAMAPRLRPRPAAPSPPGPGPTPLPGNGGGRAGARAPPAPRVLSRAVPEAGSGCSGGSASGREGSESQRPPAERNLYLYCANTKERSGKRRSQRGCGSRGCHHQPKHPPPPVPTQPPQVGRFSLSPAVAITTQAAGSVFCAAAWIPAPRRRGGGRHPAAPARARAAASQSLLQKHRDSVRVTQLGLLGGRPVDQRGVLLEGTRPSQRNHHRGLQG